MNRTMRIGRWLVAVALIGACARQPQEAQSPQPAAIQPVTQPVEAVVNDIHSQLNETKVDRILKPESTAAVQQIVREARAGQKAVSIAGGRHAMGGQQFGAGTILIDTSNLNHALRLDTEKGIVTVQAGIRWPELFAYLEREQSGKWPQWGIKQKQTGADRLSIGGALSANAHGRGLRFKPMVDDVESFTLVDADARVLKCSRTENTQLFKLAIGGYGLFGVMTEVDLRLVPRQKVERVVKLIEIDDLVGAIEERIAQGFLYGDFQFAIDPKSPDFLTRGVFSTYKPVDRATPIPENQRELKPDDWKKLFLLAHMDKTGAFKAYTTYYLSTNGQHYWSDTHQLADYVDEYHRDLDRQLGPGGTGTEMITEIYVPRPALASFMKAVAEDFRVSGANVIYGTVRFIEPDTETFLSWAKQRYASIIFNLHTAHDQASLDRTAADFRRLIDRAVERGGSYYLTYHRWATRQQIEACYPQFAEFLRLKKRFDTEERFQSEWYRFYKTMFADQLK
jgi:FAD/FMN-containing dehydrogenase